MLEQQLRDVILAAIFTIFSNTLGPLGEPDDVAKAVVFLASEDSAYINTVELMVDGGATCAPFGPPILRS